MSLTNRRTSISAGVWEWAGRVPLRQKIIGIIVAPMLILGTTIGWWVSSQLGGWLSYLLGEERVAQAMAVGMRSVFIITLFSSIAGLGVGSLLTWVLTRPILEMTLVARRVKNNDLSVRAPVWANDEIGELGRAFNDMIAGLAASRQELEHFNEQLWHRNHELAILYKLADMANQAYSVQQVSANGLLQTLESTSASAGLIIMFIDQKATVTASHNLPEAFIESTCQHLPISQYFPHPETGNAEPYIIEDLFKTTELPSVLVLNCQRLGYHTLVLIPIVGKQNLLGLLVMFCDDAHIVMSTQSRQLLGGICNQLGVTIQNSQLWEELRNKEQLRAQLLNKIVTAQEEERQRISRELHDETGQALTSLLVQLKILERADNLNDIKSQMNDIRQLVQRMLQEVRRLAADLRPSALDDLGLISAVDGYIHSYAAKTGIEVDFQTHHMDALRLAHDVEIVVYRVIQESLTNIARHARARHAQVFVRYEQKRLHVQIKDDGCGFNAAALHKKQNEGLGILGMRERIQLIGGTFSIESVPHKGTQIDIELIVTEDGNA